MQTNELIAGCYHLKKRVPFNCITSGTDRTSINPSTGRPMRRRQRLGKDYMAGKDASNGETGSGRTTRRKRSIPPLRQQLTCKVKVRPGQFVLVRTEFHFVAEHDSEGIMVRDHQFRQLLMRQLRHDSLTKKAGGRLVRGEFSSSPARPALVWSGAAMIRQDVGDGFSVLQNDKPQRLSKSAKCPQTKQHAIKRRGSSVSSHTATMSSCQDNQEPTGRAVIEVIVCGG
jgi:hypothetical protein